MSQPSLTQRPTKQDSRLLATGLCAWARHRQAGLCSSAAGGSREFSGRMTLSIRQGQMAHRRLHGEQGQDLQQVVLDDIPDDAVLVEVAAAPLGAEVLAEDHLSDVMTWSALISMKAMQAYQLSMMQASRSSRPNTWIMPPT